MSAISAQFTLSGEDYEAYLRYFYGHTQTGRRHMRRLYALGVAAFLIFVWREYDDPKFGIAHPVYFFTYMLVAGALLGGGYWYAVSRLWPSIAQSAVRLSPQKAMFTDTQVSIEEDGMRVRTKKGLGRLDWENVQEVAATDEALYLFMGGINAFILPKRAFEKPEDAEETLRRVLAVIAPEEDDDITS